MDELEILKRDWKKKGDSFNQVSEKEIYGMLHKRSSSIVKWILIISILEFLFWLVISFLTPEKNYNKIIELYHLKTFTKILNTINYIVIILFIYRFYTNFKKISTIDSVKDLMKNIIETRKTVKYYVWFNLILFFIGLIVILTSQFLYDPEIDLLMESLKNKNLNKTYIYFTISLFYLIVICFSFLFFWLFYKLLYGILLKRLNNNYKELEKIDL